MSAKQESDLSPCSECGKLVEGKRYENTAKGLVYYDVGGYGGITHSHRSAKWYEQRTINARKKPKAVEKALAVLLLNPTNKKALKTLRKWRIDKLFSLATDPTKGYASIRAVTKLLEEFTGESEGVLPGERISHTVTTSNQMPTPAETPEPEIIIHMLEANEAAKPRYDPMAIKPEVIEQDDEELPDDEHAYEPTEQERDWDTVEYDADGTRKRKPECVSASFTVWPGGEITRQLSISEAAEARRPVNPFNIRGWGG